MAKSIHRLKNLLTIATESGKIKWVQVGDKVDDDGKVMSDLETTFDGMTVRIVVRSYIERSKWWGDKTKTLYGLIIDDKKERIVFSSNPDQFEGEKPGDDEYNMDLWTLAYEIQRMIEEKDLMGSVKQKLSAMIYS
ncbi:MAG: hypothetical protein WC788_04355 [Candidatus Paceibacterota bacterium]